MDGKARDKYRIRQLVIAWISLLSSFSSSSSVLFSTHQSRCSHRLCHHLHTSCHVTGHIYSTSQTAASLHLHSCKFRNKRSFQNNSFLKLGRIFPDSDTSWLEHTTASVLDLTHIPMGHVTNDDVETISGLMAAWARKKSDQAALKVEALLKRVVDDRNAGNSSVRVTTRMYTMAIDSWAKASCGVQAAYRANDIHSQMKRIYQETMDESLRPTTISYNAVINSWSKCADPVSPYKAEELLKEMIHGWRVLGDDAVKPDVVSFTSCIDAWAKSGNEDSTTKALSLLHLMERLYQAEHEYTMKPNGTFGVVSIEISNDVEVASSHIQLSCFWQCIHTRLVSMHLLKAHIY